MKGLKGLIETIKIFGWLNIIVGAAALVISLIATLPARVDIKGNLTYILIMLLWLLGGVIYLVIASGLSKRKRWAWYLGIIAFIYGAIHNFLFGSMVSIAIGIITVGIIIIGLLIVFIEKRKIIFEYLERVVGKGQKISQPNNSKDLGRGDGIASIVFGILSLLTIPYVYSLVGIFFGIRARRKGKKKLGTIGLAISIVGLITYLVRLILLHDLLPFWNGWF